jgi:N-acetyl-gamma-glutamyl-phosphate reductase
VVDLSAAFRLRDTTQYPTFYGFDHDQTDLLERAVYGLPELHRSDLEDAELIATPGCHVTAAVLALHPLVESGMVRTDGIVVNTLTGITGAGRAPTDTNVFTNIDSNAEAYGLLGHRHTPEIEQELGAQVVFTPHLVPMSRGLLATCYARPADDADPSTDTLVAHLRQRWADEPFVVATEGSPSTKATLGSNTVHVTARYDDRTNTVIAIAALDNLTKGASGGAVQAANVALGLDETAGLPLVGVGP